MYQSGNIGFRPIEEADLEILRRLRNDMSTFLNLGTVDMASLQGQQTWWKRDLYSARDQRLTLVQIDTKEVIGVLRITGIDHENANCEVGLDLVLEKRGQGLGKASYGCVLEYLFNQKNMHMVYVRVAEFNTDASKLYETLGFERTGFYKDYLFRHGRYWDYHLMCLTRTRHNALRRT